MKARSRRITGIRLGIVVQAVTTLFVLILGFLALQELEAFTQTDQPIPVYQLQDVVLYIRILVLLIALVACASGLVLTFSVRWELRRAIRGVESISRGVAETELRRELIQEFVPLNSIIRNLGESLNRFLQQSVTDAIILVDEDLHIDGLNSNAEVLFGCRSEEVSGRSLSLLFPRDKSNNDLYRWLEEGGGPAREVDPGMGSIINQSGEWISVRLTTFQVFRGGRRLRGIVAGVFDADEWQRIREEFDRAARLSNLGLLVGGLAHEIKNPLGAIHGLVQMLAEDIPPESPKGRYYETILAEVRQLDDIMKRLLDLTSQSRWESRELRLNTVLVDVTTLMEREAEERGVALQGGSLGDGPTVMGDPERIKQAIINVMKNAIEATPRGEIVKWTLHEEGPWAIFSIRNPGDPFPAAVSSRIPAPFLSTKPGGSGLGLAITHQILLYHRGHLQVQNLQEGGVKVRLLFPALGKEAKYPGRPPEI